MLTVSKSVLKSKMLGLFRQIQSTGEEIVVTDHNKPVLKITPIQNKQNVSDVFADIRGKVTYKHGHDDTTEEWGDLKW